MAVRRTRGQERTAKRTVGRIKREKRPRIKREPSSPAERKATPRPITRSNKPVSGRVKSHAIISGTSKKIITTKKTSPGIAREKTSDIFRSNVINRPVNRPIEKAESDQFMNREGKVIRGRFGRRNLHAVKSATSGKADRNLKKGEETIRLNRYIANAGLCSRREADTFIATGCVTVNGKIISEMGYQVNPGDQVSFNGKIISAEHKVYVLLNKPKGFITTVEDPHAEKTVMDLVKNACKERIYPVGRLDRNTTGLLLYK